MYIHRISSFNPQLFDQKLIGNARFSLNNKFERLGNPSFGFNSELLSTSTNQLLQKTIAKYRLNSQKFSKSLLEISNKFSSKYHVDINMPFSPASISSFKTGKRAELKLTAKTHDGELLKFFYDSGYRGKNAVIEVVDTIDPLKTKVKYEIANESIFVFYPDKKQNKVFTASQLPKNQRQVFSIENVLPVNNPEVVKNIEDVDKLISSYLNYFVKNDTFINKMINILQTNKNNNVGIKKYSSL